VESSPGQGSAFYFDIPFEKSSTEETKEVEAIESPDHKETIERPLKILVAEDNLTNQTLMKKILTKAGHHIVLAEDGYSALKKLEESEFDIILMDVQMPELDGLEASRRIRKSEEETGKHIPIIALTARALKGDEQECLEAGMDDFLPKPFSKKLLFKILKKWTA
jgi:CheY-like chemotaxis protein